MSGCVAANGGARAFRLMCHGIRRALAPTSSRAPAVSRAVGAMRGIGAVAASNTAILCAALLIVAAPRIAVAQSNGALFLLVPLGARAVGLGEAIVADSSIGSEGIWWNAASMARLKRKDLAIHHSQTAFAVSDMIAYAMPSRVLGTLAAAAYIVNYGDQAVTPDGGGDVSVGTVTNRNYMLALSYATPAGSRLSAGLSYKFVMLRFQCTGICGNTPTISGSTQALDLGAQYRVPSAIPITIGASLRNLGPALQVKDKEQADPLPKVLQVGGKVRVPVASLTDAGATLDFSADVISDVLGSEALGGLSTGVGAALGYRETVFFRAGYKRQSGEGSGPSIGFGIERGAFGADIARRFDGLSSQLGETPTYFSLKVRF